MSVQFQRSNLAPGSPTARRGELPALFRADLRNYTGRWSTWLPLIIALGCGLILMMNRLGAGRPTDYVRVSGADLSTAMMAVSVIVPAGMGYLAGAAWIGSEHTSGSLGAWLTFNPRRVRVWLSRFSVAVVVPSLLALVGLVLAAIPVLGNESGLSKWGSDLGRFLLVVAGFSALGFSIASLGRHVLWALGAFAGYAVLMYLNAMIGGSNQLYLMHSAVADLLNGPSARIYDGDPGSNDPASMFVAAAVWIGSVLAVAAAALLVFRRRDID